MKEGGTNKPGIENRRLPFYPKKFMVAMYNFQYKSHVLEGKVFAQAI